MLRVQSNRNLLTFIDSNTRSMPLDNNPNIIPIHNLNPTDAGVDIQLNIIAFIHLQGFEFIVDDYRAIFAVFDEETMFHLDFTWGEGDLFVLEACDQPVYHL